VISSGWASMSVHSREGRMAASVGMLFVGLYLTASQTFQDAASDWRHRAAGPFLVLTAPLRFWLQSREKR
jgi:hypothetical protein